MSSSAAPITPARFAAALSDLPLSSLHAKAAELRNSLLHLRSSNAQLQPLAEAGDSDCADAVTENEQVMSRMRERLDLLQAEVEGRGNRWVAWDEEDEVVGNEVNGEQSSDTPVVNGHLEEHADGQIQSPVRGQADTRSRHGRLNNEELARRIREQMGEEDDEDGLHL